MSSQAKGNHRDLIKCGRIINTKLHDSQAIERSNDDSYETIRRLGKFGDSRQSEECVYLVIMTCTRALKIKEFNSISNELILTQYIIYYFMNI